MADVKARLQTTNTREHLIDVGLRLVQEKGYHASGLLEILKEAGVPKGSFYHHFPSKESFAKEVIQRYVTREDARFERILGQSTGTPLSRLRRYFKELAKVFGPSGSINGCLIGRMSLDPAAESSVLRASLSQAFASWESALEKNLSEAQAAGELRKDVSPSKLAGFIVNNWEGALLRSRADHNDTALQIFFHCTFDLLLR